MSQRRMFVTLLALVEAACTGPCPTYPHSASVSAEDFRTVDDGDGAVSDEECWTLCLAFSDAPGGGDSGILFRGECRANEVGGGVELTCEVGQECKGRAHATVAPATGPPPTTLAEWLARAAHDEATSVIAFGRIAAELEAHGAPPTLLARVREAGADERRHARTMRRLARGCDARAIRPRAAPVQGRSLLAFAVENAVYGRVGETWAALEALHQSRFARWPALRRAMAGIAEDEARHAELAMDLHDWAIRRLTTGERAIVAAVEQAALSALAARLGEPVDVLRVEAGLPGRGPARALLAGMVAGALRAA